MKKLLCLLTLLVLIIGSLPISAAGGEVSVTVNGKDVVFDQPPIIESGRTLVPMRAIFEALGYEVVWDNGMIDVYNSDGDNVMTLWVDNKYMWTEKADVTLDVAPKIVNSRTLVPVRAISESIGANVVWDNSTRTVIIKYTASDSSKGKCDHDNTTEKVVDTEYEEIDEDSHLCIESIREYCDDCGEIVDSYVVESEESHNFKNGVCRSCGYEEEQECKHKNTHEVCEIDIERYEQNGSDETHDILLRYDEECLDCNETISSEFRFYRKGEHSFENNVCKLCGYKQSETVTESDKDVKPPIYEKNITDWIDGAYKYISIPQGKAIRISNTSSGSLKVYSEGKYNALLRNEKAVCTVKRHCTKEIESYETISKDAEMIIENSGNSTMLVYIAAEYASYAETSERIFSTIKLNNGESAVFSVKNSKSNQNMYVSDDYEWIRYNNSFETVTANGLSGNKTSVVFAEQYLTITAKNDLTIEYPLYLVEAKETSESAYKSVNISKGETKRIYSNDKTSIPVYTDGEHSYDLVVYDEKKNKVSKQSQNIKSKSFSIDKNNYADITNQSSGTLTIKIPSKIVRVENK